MLPAERHQRIAAALRQTGMISTEELTERLGVSAETVRRDLGLMEREGLLRRVRGGAATPGAVRDPAGEEPSFSERSQARQTAKHAIGRAAARLVEPGMTLVIDVGTTAEQVARCLPEDFRGFVATPSLLVAGLLSGRAEIEVMVPGGRVRAGDQVCSGPGTVAFFEDLHPDVAFIGSGGVDATAGVTDFHFAEVATKRAMAARAARCWVLADTAKLQSVAPHRVCSLDEVTGVLTDAAPAEPLARAVREAGAELVVAPEG
ncbi:DeoR/GlpR family DNA-binding transcription regulator [Streptomyces sp. NPDC007088]|uniref:DeoR/GlpR family DNA-binding transcription regulator n=1 Tax=Streptomyces sp. NPDC007088 TaxID=3364773 RepID=UPI0036CBF355